MRAPDECCRHKVLDLIGDLALIGRPLLGHVIAERAGHAMHTALVSKIMSDPSLYEILSFDQLGQPRGARAGILKFCYDIFLICLRCCALR